MTLAKGLAGGFPIGVTLAKEHCALFVPGDHASTFGGNPLACSVALAVQHTIEEQGLIDHVATIGEYFRERLRDLRAQHPRIVDVRGRGLLIGVELVDEVARDVHGALREHGLIANILAPRIVRFVPPYIVSQEEVDEAVDIFDRVLAEMEA
jgi:acetylornithine/succinyldiaminopimelate/putrescine aminotransferase